MIILHWILLLFSFAIILLQTTGTRPGEELKSIVRILRELTENTRSEDELLRRERDGGGDGMWQPTGGTSREEWLECRGMDCQAWERTKDNLIKIYKQANHLTDIPSKMGSVDVMNIHHAHFDGTLDGCIWLTEDQSREILQQNARRKKRKLIDFSRSSFNMWPEKEAIRWKFDNEHSASEKAIVRSAFQSWMDETCVRFQELGTNDIYANNHILVTRKLTGCHSYVGRVGLVPQQLNLQSNCLKYFGIPVHEIGHALGLWHEQQRADRDSTIRIRSENLGYYAGQFSKLNTLSLNVPYDLSSVMHYAPRDGSVNGKNVMETLDPLYQHTMGQKTGMSYYDAKIINRAYCSKVCSSRPLAQHCANGGYQNPNDCDRCKCPPGFGGTYCKKLAAAKGATCGGEMEINNQEQVIESPGYTSPGYYENHVECNWLIKAAVGEKVVLRFEGEFALYVGNQEQCFHWLEVRYKDDLGSLGPRFCGYKTPTVELTSSTNQMLLVMRSNWTSRWQRSRKGFRAILTTVQSVKQSDVKTTTTTEKSTSSSTTATTTSTTTSSTTPSTTKITSPSTKTTDGTSPDWMMSNDWLWNCNFDTYDGRATWCDMTQEGQDDFDWTLIQGGTPSELTGPESAFDRNYYAYIETSNPRKRGDEATLWTPKLGRLGKHCLTFYYHMYGFHIYLLEVKVETSSGRDVVVWRKSKQQGYYWKKAQVNISLHPNDRIGFTATRGSEYSGDIALDHIHIRPGYCESRWGSFNEH